MVELIVESVFEMIVDFEEIEDLEMKIVIVGCRNVGKSMFVNMLSEFEWMIVSEVVGII